MLEGPASGKKLDLPYEIKLKIAGLIKSQELRTKRITSEGDFEGILEKENSNAVLFQISLLNHSWYSAATQLIWNKVVLTTESMPYFIRGILSSALYEMGKNPEVSREHALLMVDLETTLKELDMELMTSSKRTKGMSLESATEFSYPFSKHISHENSSEESQSPRDDATTADEILETMMNMNSIQDNDGDITVRLAQAKLEFDNRLKIEIMHASQRHRSPFKPTTYSYGIGKFVKMICIPSYDPLIRFFRLVFSFLPNCKTVKFLHPSHGQKFIPTLSPILVKYSKKFFSQYETICADDIGEEAWPMLIEGLAEYGMGIKVLNLEACNEKDLYGSKRGLVTVFPHLQNLECLRLDRLPIGSSDFSWGGDLDLMVMTAFCTKLRVISLDFCDITLESFYTLWNRCPNLEFLGFAGLHGEASETTENNRMEIRDKLKTLRFVDCKVNDDLVVKIAKHCPNLNLFRCVHEYPADFPNWNPNEALSDRALIALAENCPKLTTLAISKTAAMTSKGFIRLISGCSIKVFDFHSTDLHSRGAIGVLDNDFLLDLIPHLNRLSIINLFDQPSLYEDVLIKLLTSCPNLESVCLNNTIITRSVLEKIIEIPALKLKRLSIYRCPGIRFAEIGWFCESLDFAGKSLDALYINPPQPAELLTFEYAASNLEGLPPQNSNPPEPWSYPFVKFEDSWFMDEKLDIFSLFDAASALSHKA